MASKSKGRPTSWDAGRSRPGGGIDANPKARSRTPDAAGAARAAPTPGRAKGIMQPVQPDSVLGAIIGEQPRPRSEVIKRVWDYIKRKGLQDQTNRRMINSDEQLQPLFGKKKVSMFELTKLVNAHLS